MVERYRANEGTEQIWLVATDDPAKRHLLYTHHRQAGIIFSDDQAWLVINDNKSSAAVIPAFCSIAKIGVEDQRVADKPLTAPAWKYFNQRNGFKGELHSSRVCRSRFRRTGTETPTSSLRLSGHISGPAGILKQSRGWHCFYNTQTQSFSTDLDALNQKNTKL